MKIVLSLTAGLILLPLTAFAAPPAQAPSQAPAQAPTQAPSKAVQAPTQAPVQAPAKTAQADTGYRTYSYEPSAGYRSYSYQPTYADPYNGYTGRGPAYRTGPASQGFYRADHKITGPY
jgi:hypothetical protein